MMEDQNKDEYFPTGKCGDENCALHGENHFSWECFLEQEMEDYYKQMMEKTL